MEIDLHGYHPAEIVFNGTLARLFTRLGRWVKLNWH